MLGKKWGLEKWKSGRVVFVFFLGKVSLDPGSLEAPVLYKARKLSGWVVIKV